MNSFLFADAVRPKSVRVLRLPLLTYTFGHELILRAERNPFTLDGFQNLSTEKQNLALMQAALICSRPYSDRFKKHRWLKLWSWYLKSMDMAKEAEKFFVYKIDGSSCPPLAEKESFEMANGKQEGRNLGSDVFARIANFLTGRESSFGLKTIYDFPFGLALHLYFTQSELDGISSIENERERQLREEMVGHREDYAREQKDKCQP